MSEKGRRKRIASKSTPFGLKRNVVPDSIDLRDRMYNPPVAVAPGPTLDPRFDIPALDQQDSNACTGFALAAVINALQRSAGKPAAAARVSPYMLYSMARRYDEFPGDPEADTGSSLRGAMKGWYRHGACSARLWKAPPMPPAAKRAADDWWQDAVRRPLGAYYRIDAHSVVDMHVALNEIGVIYASAACHNGWMEGFGVPGASTRRQGGFWTIPCRKANLYDGGHAFAIIGYNSRGFIIQNSWGLKWGVRGRAILLYDDWIENGMDCWVAQLGVVTELREKIAESTTLRVSDGIVRLASDARLRKHEIGPFIIDMENNGRLSNTGQFRTRDSDISALVNDHLAKACAVWKLRDNDPVDIAIYAHGGLTSEEAAAETAARWIPALYERRIFPIFLMWETDLWSTLRNRLKDMAEEQPRPAAGLMEGMRRWWNARLERLFAVPGTAIWAEMKQNAEAISRDQASGGVKLYREFQSSAYCLKKDRIRLHLIGHSAGSIVHSYVISSLCAKGWSFDSLNLMAPAVDVPTFERTVLPEFKSGRVKRLNEFHLTDEMELKDPTCQALLGYGHSLLYLVSRSFEKKPRREGRQDNEEAVREVPILGMQKHFAKASRGLDPKRVTLSLAPGSASNSTTHGGFDDDEATMNSVIAAILNGNRPA